MSRSQNLCEICELRKRPESRSRRLSARSLNRKSLRSTVREHRSNDVSGGGPSIAVTSSLACNRRIDGFSGVHGRRDFGYRARTTVSIRSRSVVYTANATCGAAVRRRTLVYGGCIPHTHTHRANDVHRRRTSPTCVHCGAFRIYECACARDARSIIQLLLLLLLLSPGKTLSVIKLDFISVARLLLI